MTRKFDRTPNEKKPTIVGAGLIALDVVLADPSSREASVYAGGTCGNVVSILSYLGWESKAIGFLGRDIAGTRVLADLRRCGVNCDALIAVEAVRTPVFLQVVNTQGHHPTHSFLTECPSCGELLYRDHLDALPAYDFRSGASAPDVLFIDRLSRSALDLARAARASGCLVMYEPSTKSDADYWNEILRIVDVLKYSADRLVPENFNAALPVGHGFWEVQTAGDKGLRFRRRDHETIASAWKHLDAMPVARVVDTCGPGDWCTAGFLSHLLRSHSSAPSLIHENDLTEALRVGQILAAWACGFAGARGGMYEHEALTPPGPDSVVQTPQPERQLVTQEALCGRAGCGTEPGRAHR